MRGRIDDPAAERVLVLTPTGRDARMVRERILAGGLDCEVCADLPALLAGVSSGAGAAVVAQEALSSEGAGALLRVLKAQEPWSDVPVLLLLSNPRSTRRPGSGYRAFPPGLFEGANVTVLQRPLHLRLFLSSVRSAVRARRRQYQMLDLYRELERAVKLSDLFVGILGHDLRNPINAIRMGAEIILRSSPDVRALRPASRILTSADRVSRMIEQLLDFARARQGRGIPLQLKRMELGELCRETVQELEDANPDASLHLQEVGDLSGVWDRDRLAQIVSNLVGNAIKHGRQGEPISIEADGSEASLVRLRVHNAGTIPAEALPTIFEAFEQAETGKARSGLGLGLFIAREIVRAHGGEIAAQVSQDRTTFEVVLPREARAVESAPLVTS